MTASSSGGGVGRHSAAAGGADRPVRGGGQRRARARHDRREVSTCVDGSLGSCCWRSSRRPPAARLYDADAGPSFYVNVHVGERVFVLALKYRKGVYDPISTESGYATTWELGGAGTHGRDGAAYILSGLAGYMDRFLVEYLRVNESACDSSLGASRRDTRKPAQTGSDSAG